MPLCAAGFAIYRTGRLASHRNHVARYAAHCVVDQSGSCHALDSSSSPRNVQSQEQALLAFRELGRMVRTIFLLHYLSSVELPHTIQAATNKSEAFNKIRAVG